MSDEYFKKRNRFDPVAMMNETLKLGKEWAENKVAYDSLKDTESTLKSKIFEELKDEGHNTTTADRLIANHEDFKEHLKVKKKVHKDFLVSQVLYITKQKLDDLEQTDEVNKRHEMKMSRYQT
jgi:Asp-tRNA(Asn)/Glu-tRNA(Gln) amidotransferase B subunit